MRIRDTITSKWFKVEDLPGREQGSIVMTIRKVGSSIFADGRESMDLFFHEHPKPLGCNVTNRRRLLTMFGDDVEFEDLVGQRVELYAELTQDQKGTPCWGIRIRPPVATLQAASAEARERIEAARLRQSATVALAASEPPRVSTVHEMQRLAGSRPPAAPAPEHVRPMSHRPLPAAPAASYPVEPAGFVDQEDPGYEEDPFAAGGRR